MALQLARHKFTVDEYHRMAEVGLLHEDSRVELIDGEIIEMSPIGHRHAFRVAYLSQLLSERLGRRTFVWAQNPLHLDDQGEPEPDVTLLRPRADIYADKLPDADDVLLVIEVADSSLEYDRRVKAPLYARNGIADYWLVNLVEGHVIVYRDPAPNGYRSVHVARLGEELRPFAFPDFVVSVEEILG